MAIKTLEENISQAVSDFKAIKAKIIESGVEVPNNTPTSAYPERVEQVYQKGVDSTVETATTAIDTQTARLEARINGDDSESKPMYDKIYNDGIAEGRTQEWSDFWDSFQNKGGARNYRYSFIYWKSNIFYPKYDLKMGYYSEGAFWGCEVSNFAERLQECGVILDTSGVGAFGAFFAGSYVDHVPEISTVSASNLENMFQNSNIVTIDKLILKSDGSQNINSSMFTNCKSLKNIVVEGVIGKNNWNMSWSPLSKASITSVVNALSTTTSGLTVTLRLSAVNTAFETSEGLADGSTSQEWLDLAATRSNWTITLKDS